MAKEKIEISETDKKIADLKIEMLKQNQKRRSIKKEIARLFTMKNAPKKVEEVKTQTKVGGKK